MAVRTHKFASGTYRIARDARPQLRNCIGLTTQANGDEQGEIWIDPKLSGRDLLEITIHESLHAADWKLSEGRVRRDAADIAALLWRMGYRREGER